MGEGTEGRGQGGRGGAEPEGHSTQPEAQGEAAGRQSRGGPGDSRSPRDGPADGPPTRRRLAHGAGPVPRATPPVNRTRGCECRAVCLWPGHPSSLLLPRRDWAQTAPRPPTDGRPLHGEDGAPQGGPGAAVRTHGDPCLAAPGRPGTNTGEGHGAGRPLPPRGPQTAAARVRTPGGAAGVVCSHREGILSGTLRACAAEGTCHCPYSQDEHSLRRRPAPPLTHTTQRPCRARQTVPAPALASPGAEGAQGPAWCLLTCWRQWAAVRKPCSQSGHL